MTLLPLIATGSAEYGTANEGTFGSAGWPASNGIVYMPVRIPEAFTVKRVFWVNGATVNGNTNLGLYDPSGSKLWECGSTAKSGSNQTQFVDLSPDESHAAGLYYVALQHSNTTGQFGRSNPTLYSLIRQGLLYEAAGSFALPSTATWVVLATNYLPMCGLDLRG